ncbi:acyl carrier protein [Paenibacillus illinoisensis]|uniref:acyl carrier protein n=1 Tax=Paenibacillus illinoisensis TaxID=59845 RepID=UPI001C8DB7A2|nr:acyl carrier protein [Paenibacillus illinoisensis]MBY0219156.1 acyl carrier protein [Paenibacillus illinoisensis]
MKVGGMMHNELKQKVTEIVMTITKLEKTPAEQEILPIDSFASVAIIVKLEDDFSIMFDDKDLVLDNFLSIGSIVSMVAEKKSLVS